MSERGSAHVDALSCGNPRAEGPPIALGMNRRTSSFSSSTPALDLDAYRIDSRASCVLLMRRHLSVHAVKLLLTTTLTLMPPTTPKSACAVLSPELRRDSI